MTIGCSEHEEAGRGGHGGHSGSADLDRAGSASRGRAGARAGGSSSGEVDGLGRGLGGLDHGAVDALGRVGDEAESREAGDGSCDGDGSVDRRRGRGDWNELSRSLELDAAEVRLGDDVENGLGAGGGRVAGGDLRSGRRFGSEAEQRSSTEAGEGGHGGDGEVGSLHCG